MKLAKFILLFALFLAILQTTVSCGRSSSGASANSTIAPVPYCASVVTPSNPVTITGTAQYQYRANGNGVVAGPNPIRYAEIRVSSASGAIVQCGQTDMNGQFSLAIPKGSAAVTIAVASRANNSNVKAYVLTNPTQNTYHSVSASVVPNVSKSVGTLTAPANGTVVGGAFNILDKILDANEFLRTETANCSATFASCTPFTVAPLATVYWTKGFNPGTYFGLDPLSFYVPEQDRLYILGGLNGDVDNSDTDHFDNTIIIHEYGHFLEDKYSKTNSPGGNHTGNTILDPRLAWGEAWANYFQAAVTGIPVYRDTFGTADGTAGVYFNENLESGLIDSTGTPREGNFREFAITRALVDYTDANSDGADNLTAPFSEFWTLFTSASTGFAKTNLNFRNAGLFYSLQSVLPNKSNWSAIQASESQSADMTDYGNTLTLTPGGMACPTFIQAQDISMAQEEDGTPENSNQFSSNDFYRYTHGGGNFSMSMSYTTTAGNSADLDIYLYKNDYVFGELASVIAYSDDRIAVNQGSDSESFSVSGLAAGVYMINVNVYTKNRLGAGANYNMNINGSVACPD